MEYENSYKGVEKFLIDESTLTEKELKDAIYERDPEYPGVWKVTLAQPGVLDDDIAYIIVYLDEQDFEEVFK